MDISSKEFVREFSQKARIGEEKIAGFNPIDDSPVIRATVAKIIHEYLKNIRKEAESPDWKRATVLKDLYDCRTCVAHIAEVFCKGIMDCKTILFKEEEVRIFDLKGHVSFEEADLYIERAINPLKRMFFPSKEDISIKENIDAADNPSDTVKSITDLKSLNELVDFVIVDVGNSLVGAKKADRYNIKSQKSDGDIVSDKTKAVKVKNISLNEFVSNPFLIKCDMAMPLIFVCENGYKAFLAADMAVSAGYEEVYRGCRIELMELLKKG